MTDVQAYTLDQQAAALRYAAAMMQARMPEDGFDPAICRGGNFEDPTQRPLLMSDVIAILNALANRKE